MPYQHVVDLLRVYARLLFQLGEYEAYLLTKASVTERIVITEQSKGITYLASQIREAILSYSDDGVDSFIDKHYDSP